MLFFFETKNIGKKKERLAKFIEYDDKVSGHDMDFDWADETIHASYGKKWLGKILQIRNEQSTDFDAIRDHCGQLFENIVNGATEKECAETRAVADKLIKIRGNIARRSALI